MRKHWPGAIACLIALGVYWRTASPTVFAYDSAELAITAHTLGLAHSPGYPLYALLGKLFTLLPVGNTAYRVNLMSAVFGGLGIAALYACLYSLVRSRAAAFAGALAFAFSYTYWAQAVVAEVYTLQIFLVGSALACLLIWWHRGNRAFLLSGAAFGGFALTNHTSACLLFPGVLYLMWRAARKAPLRRLDWALVVGCFLAPLLTYAYVPIRDAMNPAHNWPRAVDLDVRTLRGFWLHVSGSAFRPFLSFSPEYGLQGTASFLSWLGRNFMWLGLPFGLAGLVWLWRHDRVILWFSIILLAPMTAVFVNYDVYDQEVFFLTPFFLWTWWMAAGFRALLDGVQRRLPDRRVARLAAVLILLAPALFSLASNLPSLDFSRQTALAEDCRDALTSLPQNAWVFSGWTVATPLMYLQIVEGLRPDVEVYDSSHLGLRLAHKLLPQGHSMEEIEELTGAAHRRAAMSMLDLRPVYVTYVDHALSLAFDFAREGSLYTISPKPDPGRAESVRTRRPFAVVFDDTVLIAAVTASPVTLGPADPLRVTFSTAVLHPTSAHYRLLLVVTREGKRDPIMIKRYEPGSLEFTTDEWTPGVFVEQSYDVGLRGPLEPGDYLLSVGVVDGDDLVAPTDPSGIEAPCVAVTPLHIER